MFYCKFLLPGGYAIYGLVLCVGAALVAGWGHGSYALWGLFSSPFALCGYRPALFSIPLLWLVAGILATTANPILRRKRLLVFLTIHYFSAAFVLTGDRYGDWSTLLDLFLTTDSGFDSYSFLISISVYIYLAGQTVLWIRMLAV